MTLGIEIDVYKQGEKKQTNSNIPVFLSSIAFRLLIYMHLSLMLRLVESLLRVFSQRELASCWRHGWQRWGCVTAGFPRGRHWLPWAWCLWQGAVAVPWRAPRLAVALPPASLAGSDSGWHRLLFLLPCFSAQVLVQKYLIWISAVLYVFGCYKSLFLSIACSATCTQHKIANAVMVVRDFHLTLFRTPIPCLNRSLNSLTS